MELELRLDPQEASRLTRLRCIAAATSGRPRVQRQRVIWHDSPDQALAVAGLALTEERGRWHLQRLVPGSAIWPPGAPAPVVERALSPSEFEYAVPPLRAPVASLEARLATYALATDSGTLAMGLLRGTLRSVADEQPVCRVLLAGDEAAIHRLALEAASHLRLDVPPACLAAEALALAHGAPPPPRRLGHAELPELPSVAEAFAFVVGHLADVILHFAATALDPRAGPEAVHQTRVAVRRLRSCFSVFRPVVQCAAVMSAEADLQAFNQRLAPARDWDVFMTETAPAILADLPDDPRLQRLLGAAERRRKLHHAVLRDFLLGPEFRRLGIALAWLAGARSWQTELDPVAQDGLRGEVAPFAVTVLDRRLRKLRGSAEEIGELPLDALHDVRLRAKRLRYAAEVFAPLFPGKVQRRFLERLSRLQQRLGDLNDAVVASTLMAEVEGGAGRHAFAAGVVQGFTAARAGASRGDALRAWEKFRRQEAFWG